MKKAFNRNIFFLIFVFIELALWHKPVIHLALLSLNNQLYSHFLGIPVVSLFFFTVNRKTIFRKAGYSPRMGVALLASGLLLYILGISAIVELNPNDHLSLMMASMLMWLYGSFVFCYGARVFRKAMFPLLFLMFMIPIPTFILEPLIHLLLIGTSHVTHGIFVILDVPFFRNGFVFELRDVAIEIAKACSGIRSTLGLFIVTTIAGYLFLQTGWKKVALVLVVFPITVVKNAIRISVLTMLAIHVDMSFLTGSFLHSSGGFIFYILALLLMTPILWYLRKSERQKLALEGI
jgi:exosortase